MNCDGNVTYIVTNETDSRYHTVDDNKYVVDLLLNNEADRDGFRMMWDHDLYLRRPIIIHIGVPVNMRVKMLNGKPLGEVGFPDEVFTYHLVPEGTNPSASKEYRKTTIINEEKDLELVPYYMITISGELTETIYVEANGEHNLGESTDQLKQFLDSKKYAIGDIENNTVVDGSSTISGDMNLVIIQRHAVVIELEEDSRVLGVDVNITDIAQSISVVTGVDAKNIFIEVVTDDKGYAVKVIVVLQAEDLSKTVVTQLNDLIKDNQCNFGLICRASQIYFDAEGQSISLEIGNRFDIQLHYLLLLLLIIMVMA